MPTVTQFQLSVSGVVGENDSNSQEVLSIDTQNQNSWKEKRDKVKMIKENQNFYLCFNINEEDFKINYSKYKLVFNYLNPLRIPVTLNYDNVEIDDDKKALFFFHDMAEFKEFKLEA